MKLLCRAVVLAFPVADEDGIQIFETQKIR